jgi:hypothetical protein
MSQMKPIHTMEVHLNKLVVIANEPKLSRGNNIEWSESDGPSHKSTKQLPIFNHHLGNFSTKL